MKYEWRKKEKEYYMPKEKPELVEIPEFKFFTLEGQGNPNSEAFKECIGVLYSLSYAIRMMPKNGTIPDNYYEYTVYPLEGIWDLTDKGKQEDILIKDELIYKLMIRQPDFVTDEIAHMAIETVRKKKCHSLLEDVKFESIKDGLSVQMLHVGSYDDEPRTFSIMKDFCSEKGLEIKTLAHKEIYLSDFRRTEASKLKTVLRYSVAKA